MGPAGLAAFAVLAVSLSGPPTPEGGPPRAARSAPGGPTAAAPPSILDPTRLRTADPDPLYGRVTTEEGTTLEGFLRWDRNEADRTDFLDALKPIPRERVRAAERLDPAFAARQRKARSIVAFGTRITWDEDDTADPPASTAAIRFAHLTSLSVLDRRSARLVLTSGDSLTLRSSSSDLGRGMRALLVTEVDGTEHEVRWTELERVDLLPAPAGRPPRAERLFGTVTTWSELELTGAVAWDLDEILATDVLDGRAGGDDREIAFGDIERIEWESDRSARVVLRTGETMVLRGTNDVNRDNRGIEVSDPSLGRAVVTWEDFRSVRFHEAPPDPAPPWPDFAPAAAIRGTAFAADGRVLEGVIRWNNDQTALWESVDGWVGDTRVRVEFGTIRSLRKVGEHRLEVVLRDGRMLELEDDGPEDETLGSRGVYVTAEGRSTRLILWRDFDRLELTHAGATER